MWTNPTPSLSSVGRSKSKQLSLKTTESRATAKVRSYELHCYFAADIATSTFYVRRRRSGIRWIKERLKRILHNRQWTTLATGRSAVYSADFWTQKSVVEAVKCTDGEIVPNSMSHRQRCMYSIRAFFYSSYVLSIESTTIKVVPRWTQRIVINLEYFSKNPQKITK